MSFSDNCLIAPSTSIRDAILAIEGGNAQIALVTDSKKRLVGTVTDGDIRRGLLRGFGLESPAERIMFRNFRWLPPSASEREALTLMREQSVHQVPVLDDDGRVVNLFLLGDLLKPSVRKNPVLLMAGGKGLRLRPLTENTPKPMLHVGGKPILERILESLAAEGFHDIWISVNYLKTQIQDYFGDGTRWSISIQYLEEEQPMGTAGAAGLLPQRHSAPLLVMNGDVLTRVDLGGLLRFHNEQNSSATLCLREYPIHIPYGVVHIDGTHVTRFEEKPILHNYVNAGLYVLNREILDLLPSPPAFCDMPTLLERAMRSGFPVNAFPIHEYWLDVGHPEALDRANGDWA